MHPSAEPWQPQSAATGVAQFLPVLPHAAQTGVPPTGEGIYNIARGGLPGRLIQQVISLHQGNGAEPHVFPQGEPIPHEVLKNGGDISAKAVRRNRSALPVKNPSPEARVSHYRIELDLTPSLHRLRGSAAVKVANGGTGPAEELLFVLHPDFEDNAVDGTKSVSREGQFVRVQLERPLPAGAETTLTFRYQGTVVQWRKDNFSWMNSGLLANVVADTNLMLAGNYGWYPLLGGEPVAWAGPARTSMPGLKAPPDIHPLVLRKPAAEFSLTVTGWSKPLFTNLAQGAAGTWEGSARSIWMVGGDLAKFGNEHVQVLVPAELEKQADTIVAQQSPAVERLQAFVPLEEPGPLLFVAVGGRSAFGVVDKGAGEPFVAPGAVVRRNVFSVSPLTAWWPALGMQQRPEQNKVELALAALMAQAAGLENDPAHRVSGRNGRTGSFVPCLRCATSLPGVSAGVCLAGGSAGCPVRRWSLDRAQS